MSSAVVAEVGAVAGLVVQSWRDLGGGFTTNLALCTADGTSVARVHPATTSRARIAAEQAARRLLADAGVPTVVPHALLSLSGGRHVEVEPYVDASETLKTPSRLVSGYAVLARLHDVLATAALPTEAASVRWSNHVRAQDAVAVVEAATGTLLSRHGPEFWSFTADLLTHVRSVVAEEGDLAGCSPEQLTHGDSWDGNVLFDGEEVAAVLDRGFMALRPRVDDLALPFWFWLLEPGRGLPTPDDVELLARLEDAHDDAARMPLSAQERAVLPLVVARQPAWFPSAARAHVLVVGNHRCDDGGHFTGEVERA